MDQIVLDAAQVGTAVSLVMQLLKVLPKPFLKRVFGMNEDTRKARLQLLTFVVVLICTGVTGYTQGLAVGDTIGFGVLVLISSYGVYKSVVKRGSDLLPKGTFKI